MASQMKQVALSLAVCLTALIWMAVRADAGSLTIPQQANANIQIVLKGVSAQQDPSTLLKIFVGSPEGCCDGKTPIAGRYNVNGQIVTFDPAFDFVEGQLYTVLAPTMTPDLTGFTISAQDALPPPQVLAIYPSGDVVPENTLRFYIHFSTPMRPHMATDFIKLVDASGTVDTAAFMTFTQELWSEDRKRLTLLMDPGRIKRGVAQNLTLGPALRKGDRYSIVVEGGWPSAMKGQEAPRYEKPFLVSDPLRDLPDTDLWQFQRPRAATLDPLVISFDRPFDQQQLQTAITVRNAAGQIVRGTVSVDEHEKRWRFEPDDLWMTPTVRLDVDARLEDVAGNNFRELLDHAVGTDMQTIDHKQINLDLMPAP